MPGLFVFAILMFVIFVVAALVALFTRKSYKASKASRYETKLTAPVAAAVAGVALLVAVLATVFSSFNAVGTYDIGVTTSFGRVLGYVGPGAQWVAPWENVSLMDESVQQTDDVLIVRVAGQQTAKADVKLRWRLVPGATDSLFRQYKGNTRNVETALVKPELNVAMNSVYDGYDPILPLSTGAKPGTPDNPTTQQLSDAVKVQLQSKIGTQVEVDTLIVAPLVYDATVTQRINSVLAQTAQTDKAKESVKTAEQQAAAYRQAAAAINSNPMVLVKQCLDEIADGQLNPPAGFSCWPGQGSGIVLPSAGK